MKIVAAVDTSKSSELVIQNLLGLNLAPDAEVKLVSVARTEDDAAARQLLDSAQKDLKQLLVCNVVTELAKGDPKNCIVDAAKHFAADLIIMGSRGHKGVDLILLGSVSQGVLMQAPCPVLIVKSGDLEESLRGGFKRVLIAADNSEYSQAALNWLRQMSWSSDTVFKLITVLPPLSDSFGDEQTSRVSTLMLEHDNFRGVADAELCIMQEFLEKGRSWKVIREVREGDPREVILNAARSWNADLIVMGSHGKTGLTKLLLGSVSQAVSLHAFCSVAIVRGLIQKSHGMQQTGRFVKPAAKKNE